MSNHTNSAPCYVHPNCIASLAGMVQPNEPDIDRSIETLEMIFYNKNANDTKYIPLVFKKLIVQFPKSELFEHLTVSLFKVNTSFRWERWEDFACDFDKGIIHDFYASKTLIKKHSKVLTNYFKTYNTVPSILELAKPRIRNSVIKDLLYERINEPSIEITEKQFRDMMREIEGIKYATNLVVESFRAYADDIDSLVHNSLMFYTARVKLDDASSYTTKLVHDALFTNPMVYDFHSMPNRNVLKICHNLITWSNYVNNTIDSSIAPFCSTVLRTIDKYHKRLETLANVRDETCIALGRVIIKRYNKSKDHALKQYLLSAINDEEFPRNFESDYLTSIASLDLLRTKAAFAYELLNVMPNDRNTLDSFIRIVGYKLPIDSEQLISVYNNRRFVRTIVKSCQYYNHSTFNNVLSLLKTILPNIFIVESFNLDTLVEPASDEIDPAFFTEMTDYYMGNYNLSYRNLIIPDVVSLYNLILVDKLIKLISDAYKSLLKEQLSTFFSKKIKPYIINWRRRFLSYASQPTWIENILCKYFESFKRFVLDGDTPYIGLGAYLISLLALPSIDIKECYYNKLLTITDDTMDYTKLADVPDVTNFDNILKNIRRCIDDRITEVDLFHQAPHLVGFFTFVSSTYGTTGGTCIDNALLEILQRDKLDKLVGVNLSSSIVGIDGLFSHWETPDCDPTKGVTVATNIVDATAITRGYHRGRFDEPVPNRQLRYLEKTDYQERANIFVCMTLPHVFRHLYGVDDNIAYGIAFKSGFEQDILTALEKTHFSTPGISPKMNIESAKFPIDFSRETTRFSRSNKKSLKYTVESRRFPFDFSNIRTVFTRVKRDILNQSQKSSIPKQAVTFGGKNTYRKVGIYRSKHVLYQKNDKYYIRKKNNAGKYTFRSVPHL